MAKVKNNKQRDNAAKDQEEKAKAGRGSNKENDETSGSTDVLGEQEDQDVIF